MNTGRSAIRRDFIRSLMANSPITRNQIAAISGLSNPYIKELEAGAIANVGREKLLALGIALDLNLEEIDQMLMLFDRDELCSEDIPTFLDAARRCRISAALHPVHDSYTFDLMMLSAEQDPGPHVIVSPRPASCLRAGGHRLYAERRLVRSHPLYGDLVSEINRERRRRLMMNLNDYRTDNYLCEHCLRDYLYQCNDPEELRWRIRHIQNTVNIINTFDRYRLHLTSECPSFIFVLRSPAQDLPKSEKLVIAVLPPHRMKVRASGLLAGFATDSKAVISNFKKELRFLKKAIIPEYEVRGKLVAYMEGLAGDLS